MLLVSIVVSLALLAMPVSSKPIRLTQLALLALGVVAALSLVWSWRGARVAAIALIGGPVALVASPGRAVDEPDLRRAYVSELTEMVGTDYRWGGEGRAGIDCSGLPRKALLDATLERGLATANPTLLRRAADLWWNDTSARALGARHRGTTVAVTSGAAIRNLDAAPLSPGDLAVTRDGVHLIVYVGRDRWIQADPLAGQVITVARDADNSWLQRPVEVVRWRLLAGDSSVR